MDEATDSDHGQAGVLDLSKAVPLEGGLVLSKVERVERVVTRGALAEEGLVEGNNAEDLDKGDPEDDLLAAALQSGKELCRVIALQSFFRTMKRASTWVTK